MIIVAKEAGILFEFKNDSGIHRDTNYASVTAPQLTFIQVFVDGELHDAVFVGPGASHSWWTSAGGKLLPTHGVNPGSYLKITTDGPCALRIDWND